MNKTSSTLLNGFNKILARAGNQVSVKYYSVAYTGVYDDEVTLTQSGNIIWTSGVVFPITQGSEDAVLLEQGKIGLGDSKIYLAGSLVLSPTTGSSPLQTKIGIGSPGNSFYSVILPGGTPWTLEDNDIYKVAYIRRLTGSFAGE